MYRKKNKPGQARRKWGKFPNLGLSSPIYYLPICYFVFILFLFVILLLRSCIF